jgi:hypothetical protein
MARCAELSDRRIRLSQANADRPLFCGFRLSCTKNRHRSRTAARMRRRKRRSRTPKGINGFDARDFAFFDFPMSSSLADCRSSSSAFVRRCTRPERAPLLRESGEEPALGLDPRVARRAGWGVESRAGSRRACSDACANRLRSRQRATPHPAFGHLPQRSWGRGPPAVRDVRMREGEGRRALSKMCECPRAELGKGTRGRGRCEDRT